MVKKGPGRPRKPGQQNVMVSCSRELVERLDRWRRSHPTELTRPQAIRWLCEVALKVLVKDEKD